MGWLLRLIGLLILAHILSQVEWSRIQEILRGTSLAWVVLALLGNIPLFLTKALRWQILLRSQDIRVPFRETFLYYMSSFFLGYITPGRAGEFSRIFYLKRHGVSMARGFSSVLLDKVYDLYFLLALGLIGFWRFELLGMLGQLAWVCFFILLLSPLAFLHGPTVSRVIAWGGRLLSRKFQRINPAANAEEYLAGLRAIGLSGLVWAGLLTLVGFLVFFGQCEMLVRSLRLDAPFVDLVLAMALSSLAAILPVTFAGVGVREFVLIHTFKQFGLGLEAAVAYSLLIFVSFIMFGGLLGLVCWLFRPVSFTRNVVRSSGQSIL